MSDFFQLLVPFLLLHVVFDFYLQPKSWVESKKTYRYRAPELYVHSLLHGVVLIVPAIGFGIDWRAALCVAGIVAVTHFAIDLWKVTSAKGNTFSHFVIDQVLHVTVLVSVAFYITDSIKFISILQHDQFDEVMIIALAYLLILKPTSIIIGSILGKYPISGQDNKSVTGLVAGGELIGYLERILILTFTLVGSYAAIGFVLAAKSIFRFGELNKSDDRSMAEYVLIGSLLSVVITILVGTVMSLGFSPSVE